MHRNAPGSTPTHGNTEAAPNRLHDSQEARALLGNISERKFRQLTGSGELRAKKIGNRVYVEQSAIDEFIAALPSVGTPA